MNEDNFKECNYCGREESELNDFHGSEICDQCLACENYNGE